MYLCASDIIKVTLPQMKDLSALQCHLQWKLATVPVIITIIIIIIIIIFTFTYIYRITTIMLYTLDTFVLHSYTF